VHLSGHFETQTDADEDQMFYGDEAGDDDSSEEEENVKQALVKNLKAA